MTSPQQQQQTVSETEKEVIKKEVKEQFNHLITAINQLDGSAWSEYYSKNEFVSAIAGTDFYAERSAWVGIITNYFSTRERQHVEPVEVRVTALSRNLALMTSEEKSEMELKNGPNMKSKHFFTMLWKKEQDGWKIVHSHESWTDELN
ncbi:MAG: nuclear transport factor 2 family protein [Chlorobiales bacterium]|nr:nuclear transport factor 2 family protein [Chlorobiales bacterium]